MSTHFSRVDAGQFQEALNRVLRTAAKRSKVPMLEEAVIRFEENRCTITCTNLTQWCQAVIPASGEAFAFGFTKTRSILTACQHFSGELEFSFTSNPTEERPDPEGILVIRNRGRRLQCRTIPASDFPELPKPTYEAQYAIHAEKLLERFKRVKYALSGDTNRPARCCVEFLDNRIVTVDGYRLAVSADPGLTVEKPFFIPPEAMTELQMFKGLDCALSVGKEWAAFENDSLRLLTRIPANDGLDIDQAIPKSFHTEYPVSVDTLWDEVKYLSEFITTKNKAPIRFDGQTLALETEEGSYSSTIGLPAISARGFNAKYLLDGLGQFKAKKVDTVTMKIGGPVSPILLTDGGKDLAMVLPVRLRDAA